LRQYQSCRRERRTGFIEIALEKNRQAIPFIEEARIPQNRIEDIDRAEDLPDIHDIRVSLL
jgi:hypothetical protein